MKLGLYLRRPLSLIQVGLPKEVPPTARSVAGGQPGGTAGALRAPTDAARGAEASQLLWSH